MSLGMFSILPAALDGLTTFRRCFLLPLIRPYLQLPYLARESELETLKLPADRKVPFMRCQEGVYDQVHSSHRLRFLALTSHHSLSVQKILDSSLRTTDSLSSSTRRLVARPTSVERFSSSMREWSYPDSPTRSRRAAGTRRSSSRSRLVSASRFVEQRRADFCEQTSFARINRISRRTGVRFLEKETRYAPSSAQRSNC